MSKISLVTGAILVLLGPVGYFLFPSLFASVEEAKYSLTAFIPSAIGVILMICGAVVMAKPELRKHVMHVAALVGLLGFGAACPGLLGLFKIYALGETGIGHSGALAKSILAIVCLVYVVLCVKSFIDARRARTLAA